MSTAQIRKSLLALHQTLVERERRDYETLHPRTTSADFLQALIADPWFAWLTPLTTLIVRLDELEDAKSKASAAELAAWIAQARKLLAPGEDSEFNRRYATRIQQSPEVAVAHGAVVKALKSAE